MEQGNAVGPEMLRTGGKILTYIAARMSTGGNAPSPGDILSKHVTEFAENFDIQIASSATQNCPQAGGGGR